MEKDGRDTDRLINKSAMTKQWFQNFFKMPVYCSTSHPKATWKHPAWGSTVVVCIVWYDGKFSTNYIHIFTRGFNDSK